MKGTTFSHIISLFLLLLFLIFYLYHGIRALILDQSPLINPLMWIPFLLTASVWSTSGPLDQWVAHLGSTARNLLNNVRPVIRIILRIFLDFFFYIWGSFYLFFSLSVLTFCYKIVFITTVQHCGSVSDLHQSWTGGRSFYPLPGISIWCVNKSDSGAHEQIQIQECRSSGTILVQNCTLCALFCCPTLISSATGYAACCELSDLGLD